jgi:uncharacterized protein YjiS (DUF1127 family)
MMRNRIRALRDTAHLFEQPDHILRDIGVRRSEIAAVVRFGIAGSMSIPHD